MVSAGYSGLKYCGPFQTFHRCAPSGLGTFKTFNRYAPFKSFKTCLARRGGSKVQSQIGNQLFQEFSKDRCWSEAIRLGSLAFAEKLKNELLWPKAAEIFAVV
jgi:hypothetical protein